MTISPIVGAARYQRGDLLIEPRRSGNLLNDFGASPAGPDQVLRQHPSTFT